jgi:FtsH-binding integral membrane protein
MWFLAILGSCLLVVLFGWLIGETGRRITEACLINVVYLSYLVYDLAALLTRRRLGEEVGAVLDLYRDVLNMFSYPIRVWKHWRTHKIWSAR